MLCGKGIFIARDKVFAFLDTINLIPYVIDNPKFFTKYQKKLAFLQKSLARKKKGSTVHGNCSDEWSITGRMMIYGC